MGRKKIAIKPIAHASTRRATFEKRRIGLLKKAMELSILCKSTISLTIYTGEGDVYVYASEPYENVVQKFQNYRGPYRLLTNDHLDQLVPGKSSSSSIGFEIIKQPTGVTPNANVVMPTIGNQNINNILPNSDTTNSSTTVGSKGQTPPSPGVSYQISPTKRRRTSSVTSIGSTASLQYGLNQLNVQHNPYGMPNHYPPAMYGQRMHPSMHRREGYEAMPMINGYPPNVPFLAEHTPQVHGGATDSGDVSVTKSEGSSIDAKFSGKRRSFSDMMEEDLVPDFDVGGMFDPEDLIPPHMPMTSAFLE
eukprot:100915_1